MTEEQQDRLDAKEGAAQDEGVQQEPEAADLGENAYAQEPAKRRNTGWAVAGGVIAAILALLTIVLCIAAAAAIFSGGREETPLVTATPLPTRAPGQALIIITEPEQGKVVDINQPVRAQGRGAGLPEGNVVVEALDWRGNVLERQPTTLQGPDVGTGGEGTWSIELNIDVEPGTAGEIRAYSPSPADGSIVAEDRVEVSLGQTSAVQAYISINAPSQGATLEVSSPIRVSGMGAGLPEGNLVVVAVDESGEVLAEQPATLQGPDVGAGGEGSWSVELAVPASGLTSGYIGAFAASPKQRDFLATDHIRVTFSGEYTLEGPTWLLDKTIPGSEITVEFTPGAGSEDPLVAGTAGCNTYRGTYVVITRAIGRNRIEFGPLATTRMMCDEALMEQERLYLSALEAATRYRIEGYTLTIEYPGGELLFYDKNGPRPRR